MRHIVLLAFGLIVTPAFAQSSTSIQNQLIEARNACLRSQIAIYRRIEARNDRASKDVTRLAGNSRKLCEFGRREGLGVFQHNIDDLEGMRGMMCFDSGDEERINEVKAIYEKYNRSVSDECRKARM